MIDLARVKAVIFDMDDTLLNWREAEHGAIGQLAILHFRSHGIPESRVREVYDAVMAENFAAWKAKREWWYVADRLKLLLARLQLHDRIPVDELVATFSREATVRLAWLEGAREALQACRAAGFKTALLTNGRGEVQRPKVYAFGLHTEVDFVGITGELGAWKPDAKAFLLVLDKLGVRPEHAVMVGDNEDFDIIPAKELGMQTVWVNKPVGPSAKHTHADLIIRHPGDLRAFLPAQGSRASAR